MPAAEMTARFPLRASLPYSVASFHSSLLSRHTALFLLSTTCLLPHTAHLTVTCLPHLPLPLLPLPPSSSTYLLLIYCPFLACHLNTYAPYHRLPATTTCSLSCLFLSVPSYGEEDSEAGSDDVLVVNNGK